MSVTLLTEPQGYALRAQGYLGASEDIPPAQVPFDVRAALEAHGERLAALQATAEKDLFFRKIATAAAIAGALFAAVRLTDIWLAVKRQRRSSQ